MIELADSHAHIYSDQFDADREDVIARAIEGGVSRIYMPNVDHESIDSMLEVASRHAGVCIPMMGLHPCSVKRGFERELYEVEDYLSKGGFCAVGEIGTDLYWDKTLFEEQQEAFRIQCGFAVRHKLPVVIHCRESIDETIDLVKEFEGKGLFGVFHCFTGTLDQAKTIIGMGFKLGLGGVATFKKGGLEPVIQEISLEHVLLETDCPYLAPTPYRGKRNEPIYVRLVGEKIATDLKKDLMEVAEITTRNTKSLFTPQ